jgi:hypothetical protein
MEVRKLHDVSIIVILSCFSEKKHEKHEIHLTHKGGELNGKTYLSTSFGGNTVIGEILSFNYLAFLN